MDDDFDVTSAMANRMSLFYAHATPMLNVLSDTTSRFVSEVSTCLCRCLYFMSLRNEFSFCRYIYFLTPFARL